MQERETSSPVKDAYMAKQATNETGACRASASYMLKQRADFMRRDALQKMNMADKLERLAGYFDGRVGDDIEQALWHLATNYRD